MSVQEGRVYGRAEMMERVGALGTPTVCLLTCSGGGGEGGNIRGTQKPTYRCVCILYNPQVQSLKFAFNACRENVNKPGHIYTISFTSRSIRNQEL